MTRKSELDSFLASFRFKEANALQRKAEQKGIKALLGKGRVIPQSIPFCGKGAKLTSIQNKQKGKYLARCTRDKDDEPIRSAKSKKETRNTTYSKKEIRDLFNEVYADVMENQPTYAVLKNKKKRLSDVFVEVIELGNKSLNKKYIKHFLRVKRDEVKKEA